MDSLEIDSFVMKFKNLWRAGRNASLTIKANAGKALVNLSVELEHHADCDHPQHVNLHNGSRNGPARQRRRQKRAATREAEAVEKAVTEHDVAVKVIVDGKDTVNPNIAEEAKAEATENIIEEVIDEFCSDEEYSRKEEESSEIFKLIFNDSCKNENEILEEIKKNLTYTFNYYKVKKEDRNFKVVKSEKFCGGLKILLKVKDIPEALQAVNGLKTWKTEVLKIQKKRTFPPSSLSQ